MYVYMHECMYVYMHECMCVLLNGYSFNFAFCYCCSLQVQHARVLHLIFQAVRSHG